LSAEELHEARVNTAKRRVVRVLRARVVAYRRELERQVCEVGFNFATAGPEDRPEPEHFSRAIEQLAARGEIGQRHVSIGAVKYVFWHSADASDGTIEPVLERKFNAFQVYNRIERIPEKSGYHAEWIHHESILSTERWGTVGLQHGKPIKTLDRYRIADGTAADVDLAGHHLRTGIRFAGQVKNGREWIYPANKDIWNLLGAAAQLHAVPVFIQRRVPEFLYTVMKLVGGFAIRTTKQILPPNIHDEHPIDGLPSVADALKELGFYSDVDFIDKPLPRHIAFWNGPLDRDIAAAWERFEPVIDDIAFIAYEERLASGVMTGKASGKSKRDVISAFVGKVSARLREEERMEREAREAEDALKLMESIDPDEIPF
jgi:hypothetical protein